MSGKRQRKDDIYSGVPENFPLRLLEAKKYSKLPSEIELRDSLVKYSAEKITAEKVARVSHYEGQQKDIEALGHKCYQLREQIETRQWAEAMLTREPVVLDSAAVAFIDHTIADEVSPRKKRSRAARGDAPAAGKIYSLFIALDENAKFRLVRDCEREFSHDGRAIVFEAAGHNNAHKYAGILDVASRQLRIRWAPPFLGLDHRAESSGELLAGRAAEVFTAMGADPREFFNQMGQKHGMCMICGRTLTAEQSKKYGYGPDCAQHLGWKY